MINGVVPQAPNPSTIDFERDGFAIIPAVFAPEEIGRLIDAMSQVSDQRAVRTRGGVYAIRDLLAISQPVRELAASRKLRGIVETHLAPCAFPVRATLFDKIAGANWLVPWHQDLTICVSERIEVPGYGPWSTKAGACHVQPPVSILESMLSVRIHLDDCDESNGALRVLAGTHTLGRLSAAQIGEEQQQRVSVPCAARAGDVLLMRPLLVHASSAASRAAHRRVVHIDYASCTLDGGLRWLSATRAHPY